MLERTPVRRLLTPEEATQLVGDDVPPAEPTVTQPTVAQDEDTGEPVFAYLPLGDVSELRRAVMAPEYGEGMIRANGVRNRARTFGYRPRRPVYQREGCGPTALASHYPETNRAVCSFADRLAAVISEQVEPKLVTEGREAVSEVSPDWRLGESQLWTSGVINQSSVLPYHRDAFNFPAWSAMPVLRRHMDGGFLRIPEYGAVLPCRDGWGVFFAGYELVHGVTPMRLRRPDGYRYSVVYYALRGMKNCFEAAVETAWAKKRRTEREQDMANRLESGEPSVVAQGKGMRLGMSTGRLIAGRAQREFPQASADRADE